MQAHEKSHPDLLAGWLSKKAYGAAVCHRRLRGKKEFI